MCDYSNKDIRTFEEFDEKIPSVAKVIVRRGINYSILIEEDDGKEFSLEEEKLHEEALKSVCSVFREMIECTTEMTDTEFGHYLFQLLTACELVVMVHDGLAEMNDDNSFFLTPKGRSLGDNS